MSSRHLSPLQLRGLLKAGDLLVPGDGELPPFSRAAVAGELDRIADFMTVADRGDFRMLMTLFALLPRFVVAAILHASEASERAPGFLRPPLRLLNVGVKGVVFTLYYSGLDPGGRVHRAIGWDATSIGNGPEGMNMSPMQRAREAQPSIRKLSVKERLRYIRALREVVLGKQDWIVDQIQAATGKSRSDALMSEIFGVLDHLAYLEKFAGKVLADRDAHTPMPLMGKKSRVWFEPLGTVLVISPWNYPFYQALVPCTSALICGNAVVYKPSEYTPLKGVVEEVLREAGVPESWIQVVYGDGKLGTELIDQRPDKIFFTGSTRTGKRIMEQASKYLIPVELELGGKDPMIVFEDANLERAAAGAAWGAFTNTGQSCTSVERLFVQESIYEKFRDELVKQARRVKQEVDRDGGADIGAMTTPAQIEIVARHVEDAKTRGAQILSGEAWDGVSGMIPPIVIDRVSPEMAVYREETFGPVIALMPFSTEEEAIRLANDTEYGLSASVWSKDLVRATRVAREIVTGNVSINNVMLTEGNHALPFGGTKQSGFGRFKGEFGFYSFSNIKSVIIDQDSKKLEANWYPYTTTKYGLFQKMMGGAFGRGISAFIRFALSGMKLEGYSNQVGRAGRGDSPALPAATGKSAEKPEGRDTAA